MKVKFLLVILIFSLFSFSCSKTESTESLSVAVFVPGIIADSPVYSMLVDGVVSGVEQYNDTLAQEEKKVEVTVLEAGTNQAEWSAKITALAATEQYDVIISSNPSLPEIIAPLAKQFPHQKFIVLDAFCQGNPQIATVRYNQREQAYLTGYIAALVSDCVDMPFANPEHKIALVAAQEYPVMNNIILPGFIEGATAAIPGTRVEFRVVGNWYDAAKSSELCRALYKEGVDVILPICGGASQGVLAAAKELGFYITWFDDNGFAKAPGYVVSSSVMAQKRMAQETIFAYLNGTLDFGKATTVGIQEGYVDFIQDDVLYAQAVPSSVREKMSTVVESIKNGTLLLPSP